MGRVAKRRVDSGQRGLRCEIRVQGKVVWVVEARRGPAGETKGARRRNVQYPLPSPSSPRLTHGFLFGLRGAITQSVDDRVFGGC